MRFDGADFIGARFQAIAAGRSHSLALKADGSIVCWGNDDDGLVEIEGAFDRADFCAIVTGPEPIEVRVVGTLTTGRQFYGTDTIKIISNYLKYLGVLASHWLESGRCVPGDLSQDQSVNFVDFTILADDRRREK
jgi:hypothetical protein